MFFDNLPTRFAAGSAVVDAGSSCATPYRSTLVRVLRFLGCSWLATAFLCSCPQLLHPSDAKRAILFCCTRWAAFPPQKSCTPFSLDDLPLLLARDLVQSISDSVCAPSHRDPVDQALIFCQRMRKSFGKGCSRLKTFAQIHFPCWSRTGYVA